MYRKYTFCLYEKGTVLDELFGNLFYFQLANTSPSLPDFILVNFNLK